MTDAEVDVVVVTVPPPPPIREEEEEVTQQQQQQYQFKNTIQWIGLAYSMWTILWIASWIGMCVFIPQSLNIKTLSEAVIGRPWVDDSGSPQNGSITVFAVIAVIVIVDFLNCLAMVRAWKLVLMTSELPQGHTLLRCILHAFTNYWIRSFIDGISRGQYTSYRDIELLTLTLVSSTSSSAAIFMKANGVSKGYAFLVHTGFVIIPTVIVWYTIIDGSSSSIWSSIYIRAGTAAIILGDAAQIINACAFFASDTPRYEIQEILDTAAVGSSRLVFVVAALFIPSLLWKSTQT